MHSSRTSCCLHIHLAILLTVLLLQSYAEAATWQDFQNRHIAPPPRPNENLNAYCDRMMKARRMTQSKCKPHNTFIHDTVSHVQQVCPTNSVYSHLNLFDSTETFAMTDCRDTQRNPPPNCHYQGTAYNRRIRVGCSKLVSQGDPIHFDAIKS